MIQRFIVIDKVSYAVPSAEQFSALKSEVVAAALVGAALLELPQFGDRAISVMVTPSVSVLFEERRIVEDDYQLSDSGVELLGDDNDEFPSFDY